MIVSPPCTAQAADTLTQLGLLWSARGYSRRSILYLLASVGFLREASSSLSRSSPSSSSSTPNGDAKNGGPGEVRQGATRDEKEMEMDGDGGSNDGGGSAAVVSRAGMETGEEREGSQRRHEDEKTRSKKRDTQAKLESMLTHAFYYLAQVRGDAWDVETEGQQSELALRCKSIPKGRTHTAASAISRPSFLFVSFRASCPARPAASYVW